MPRIAVIGTTSWGTTLAIVAARNGADVCLWARDAAEAETLRRDGENRRFVPGIPFPPSLDVTSSARDALEGAELVLFAVPSVHLRRNVRQVREYIPSDVPILSATKGLEIDTGKRMSEVLSEELGAAPGNSVCALSGPNLAGEIAAGKPASTVVASGNLSAANRAQEVLNSATFRVYTNDDIVGVELGGALKNIIAIGAGICDGLGLGDNARATFMTRGLAEISRLAVAAGGSPMTLAGLAGMGDLIATCSSKLSRNHQVGERLAEGMTLPEILAAMRNVAEGVNTTAAAVQMAGRLGVEMPIAEATHAVLFDNEPVKSAIARLLGRDPTRE